MRGAISASFAALLAALVPALSPAAARADAPPSANANTDTNANASARETARGLTAQAVKRYDAGDYALALDLFEKADALYPTPQYRVYAARAYAKLGRLRKALSRYDDAARMPLPPAAPPSFTEAQKTAAEERREVQKRLSVLRVEVTGAPAAEVALTVDGEPLSPAQWARVELDPGRHRITAKAARTVEVAQSVELGEGASSSLRLTLSPLNLARPRPFRPLAIASGAAGGAGLIVAVASGAVLAQKHSAILKECPDHLCTPAGRALINSVPPVEHLNLAGWITTAAFGAATAVFLLLDLRKPFNSSPAATSPAATSLSAGRLTGSF